jgi:phosphopantothenoylcysteine decarboxylase/phosphopantothenate--cysteine ligase
VYVISGPISLEVKKHDFQWQDVLSASEMYEAARSIHHQMDISVFAAAVADYSPSHVAFEKIKKSETEMNLKLIKNIDIAQTLGMEKKKHQIHVGFALETENEIQNAKIKLQKKNFDMVVLNSTRQEGAGFQLDSNVVEVFFTSGESIKSGLASKSEIAHFILDQIKLLPTQD